MNRVLDWWTDVFISLGKNTFYLNCPIFSNLNYVVTCHPKNFEHILKTKADNYPKGRSFDEAFDVLGDGIFNAESDSWLAQRKTAKSIFTTIQFRRFVNDTLQTVVDEKLLPLLARAAREGSTLDLQELIMRFTFDVINITISGKDLGGLYEDFPSDVLSQAIDDGQEAILFRLSTPKPLWSLLRLLRVGPEKKLAKAWETADGCIVDLILRKKEQLLKGIESEANSLLSNHIRSQGENSDWSKARVMFLRDMVLNFFLAGRNTTAAGVMWFIWAVCRNPRVEEKILQELRLAISRKQSKEGSKDSSDQEYKNKQQPWSTFDLDDVGDLVYLHAAICESLRLYPAQPMNLKSAIKGDVLPDGSVVKPGVKIMISMYSLGRIPSIWGNDCLEFKPERWILPDGTLDNDKISKLFFAFSTGKRSCLGKNTAFAIIKLAAAAVIFNFQVQVPEDQPVIKPGIMLEMKGGLKIKVKERASRPF
ncbi:PREDICTED: cytochrome P450 86B1-like [Nelumbo nucifera]|nr:PREDICTED: cytochrome P450 86B1-like [Nelumbo nucifera]